MMRRTFRGIVQATGLGLSAAWVAAAGGAAAQSADSTGQPVPWGMGFQPAATPIMEQIAWFEAYTLLIIVAITLFVMALMAVVMFRFRASRNPVPSKTTHNTFVEVVWTIVPVLILVAVAFPSFRLLFNQTTIPDPGITVKATGGQWYWVYDYMDEDMEALPSITSYMLNEEDRAERMAKYSFTDRDAPRLLAVDYPLVVPANQVVHVLSTSLDVNHAVAVPAFGIKHDAIQGRLNESWFLAEEPGIYYGQCSQLCGRAHAYMPLEVRVLEEERFDEWRALAEEDIDRATEQLLEWQAEDSGAEVAALSTN